MKVKYLMLTLVGAIALNASAQENTVPATGQLPAKNVAFARNKAGSNWFVTLQGGVAAQFLDDNNIKDLKDRLGLIGSFSIGKYHNPFFATRIQINGGHAHTFLGEKAEQEIHTNFGAVHFDFMFDLVNYFAPYKENRFFHLIPWAGLGYQHKFIGKEWSKNNVESLTANIGLMMAFRLGKRVDFVIEAQATHSNLNLSREYNSKKTPAFDDLGRYYYNGLQGMMTAGFNFRIGPVGFNAIEPMNYALINDLNSQINHLRGEVEELSKRPVSCPECPEITPVTNVENILMDKAVLFRFDSYVVDKDQLVNLYDVAQFVKETNEPITVVGYADPSGTSEYNERLSERRAKAVVDILTGKYGVPSELISIEWKGESIQPFAKKDWNRVVILRSKK
ncbi:hypothetical protein CBG53_01515 [Porphyromonas gingivalis]|uniref:OmpA family protein n=1 Tax=Porphyromonas gingivalis TaxID=837 RepID=UPI000B4DBDA1|nr:OmpA family protein [Porphyromonas gingivalis]MDP0531312.1 OmpA family protein [Porphyromonas gingivalis]MDP0624909.1 OmpA family protein [Porphyromonas gingivalis]OWP34594.1 hypothetical protein CBG53_01515 [Porphyromonas gingivalis]WKD51961.1 OmpA family protein [Porphyromonas gingivalis]WKD54011.1 OmpA family protein [Porphyromonas gingivalis]